MAGKKLENYTKAELFQLIRCYDEYVHDFFETYWMSATDTSLCPDRIQTFALTTYEQMRAEGYTSYIGWLHAGL